MNSPEMLANLLATALEEVNRTRQELLASTQVMQTMVSDLLTRQSSVEREIALMQTGLTYFTREEASEILRVSVRQLERWHEQQVFMAAKIDRIILYQGSQLIEFGQKFRPEIRSSVEAALPSAVRRRGQQAANNPLSILN